MITERTLLADAMDKDIVFLDIEMPGLNGIYVGNELKNKNPNIIIFIVTSYSEYLDDAMRFHVFRYLSKPVDPNRLFRNLKDAIELYNTTVTKIPIETKKRSLYGTRIRHCICRNSRSQNHYSYTKTGLRVNTQHETLVRSIKNALLFCFPSKLYCKSEVCI